MLYETVKQDGADSPSGLVVGLYQHVPGAGGRAKWLQIRGLEHDIGPMRHRVLAMFMWYYHAHVVAKDPAVLGQAVQLAYRCLDLFKGDPLIQEYVDRYMTNHL